ncbi:hypothetical protein J2Z19_001610 [Ensifer adhaerens]|uniref:Uncharacterized protein n=1 Tax=Ensifer adhaerens TaxID=106592 RepID=A0ACC5STC1_ENSAD|nr:hypothetical protein [Ensifer adhaerens]MBP1871898.1 hypothetical protein [Ensifer adhaerens]
MAKLWISHLSGLMKLTIILSFAAFTFSNSEQAAFVVAQSSAALVQAPIDVGPSRHCVSAAEKKSDHHKSEHAKGKCCGAMCSVFAVLTDNATLAERTPDTTHAPAVWSEPNPFFSPSLYRPPIA